MHAMGKSFAVSPDAVAPAMPELQFLSNRSHHVRVMATGHDASSWEALAVTPWSNVPAGDPSRVAFYFRDDASGRFWSSGQLPTRIAGRYTSHHGFDYSIFKQTEDECDSKLWASIRALQRLHWPRSERYTGRYALGHGPSHRVGKRCGRQRCQMGRGCDKYVQVSHACTVKVFSLKYRATAEQWIAACPGQAENQERAVSRLSFIAAINRGKRRKICKSE